MQVSDQAVDDMLVDLIELPEGSPLPVAVAPSDCLPVDPVYQRVDGDAVHPWIDDLAEALSFCGHRFGRWIRSQVALCAPEESRGVPDAVAQEIQAVAAVRGYLAHRGLGPVDRQAKAAFHGRLYPIS